MAMSYGGAVGWSARRRRNEKLGVSKCKTPKFSRLRRAKGQPLFAVDYDSFPLNYTRFGAPDPLPPHHGGAAERLNEGTAPP